MIETYGFPAMVAAADAAGKAADVKVLTYQGADAGLVTIFIVGDVSSVQSAVAVGEAEAKKVGQFRHSHIIARPDHSVPRMILQAMEDKKMEDEAKRKKMLSEEVDDISKKNMQELRKIALAYEVFPLSSQEINTVKKEELVKVLNEQMHKKGGDEV